MIHTDPPARAATNDEILGNLLAFRLEFADRWARVETLLQSMQDRIGALETKTDRLASDVATFKADLTGTVQNIAELQRSDHRHDEGLHNLQNELDRLRERVWYLAAVATVGGAALGYLLPPLINRLGLP